MFRKEALDAKKQKLHGDVFLTQPISFILVSILLFSILLIIIVLLITGSYARSEQVNGHVVPSKGMVRIQASQFGTLENVYIKEGENVRAGQQLALITVSQTSLDGDFYADKALRALAIQQETLYEQIGLENIQLKSDLDDNSHEQEELNLLIASLQQQLVFQQELLSLAESTFKDVKDVLERGYVSKLESDRRLQVWITQKIQLQIRERELVSAKSKLEHLKNAVERLPLLSQKKLADLANRQSDIDAKFAELESKSVYVITSPIDGRVVTISSASIGRSILVGQPFINILPENSVLEAELFVPSRAIGFIDEGQEVKILYDAFPYQSFGTYNATISSITESILAPSEVVAPFTVDEPVYRVKAIISSEVVEVKGRDISIQSGMTLKANIILERQSFLSWLLAPLLAVGART
jgi:membrane fusion protein